MNATLARRIASAFLPSRWHYHYTRSKLATDPLYDGVCAALSGATAPVLDLGCGIGLLVHCLRAQGLNFKYLGVDNDTGKVARAEQAAKVAQLHNAQFVRMDLGNEFPAHQGSVVILDVLQYLPPQLQNQFLTRACVCLIPGARLVIRTGMQGPGWRSKFTRAADLLARGIRWMNTGPKRYPTQAELEAVFATHGLRAQFRPLWGNTPFNNWLVIAERAQGGNTA